MRTRRRGLALALSTVFISSFIAGSTVVDGLAALHHLVAALEQDVEHLVVADDARREFRLLEFVDDQPVLGSDL